MKQEQEREKDRKANGMIWEAELKVYTFKCRPRVLWGVGILLLLLGLQHSLGCSCFMKQGLADYGIAT